MRSSTRAAPTILTPQRDHASLRLRAERLVAGGRVVLRDVEVVLRSGEVVGVSGPNGAGKTTLLRALAGLGSGPGLRRELEPARDPGVRAAVAYVGHDPGLHPDLTLADNLRLAAALAVRPTRSVPQALLRVGLAGAAGRPARACSEGMLRRAGLARAWACRPELLLLDEPTAGLDGAARSLPAELARAAADEGAMAVVATHEPAAFDDAADRWLEVAGGRVERWDA